MKKLGSLILVAIMAASMAACSDTKETTTKAAGGESSATAAVVDTQKEESQEASSDEAVGSVEISVDTKDNFVFTYQNVQIVLGSEPEATIAALGEAKSKLEVPSCAHDGTDFVYTYDNIVVTASYLTGEEKGYISDVRLLSDLVATPEGLEIGMTTDKARELYGDPDTESDVQWIFTRGTSEMMLTVKNGSIVGIEYLVP